MDRTFIVSRGVRYMVVAAFFFSMMTVFVKIVGQHVPSAEIVFIRSCMALMMTIAMLRRAGVKPWGNNKRLLLVRGLVGLVAILCFFYAIPRIPLAASTVIQYTNPVFVALFAAVVLGEAVGRKGIFSIVLCIVGVLLIAQPSFIFGGATNSLDPFVVAVAFCGAVCSGAAYAIVRKLGETEHALVVVLFFPLVSIPGSAPFLFVDAVWPTALEWLFLVCIGLTSQVGQVYMTRSYHAEKAATASTASYIQILFAALWGILLFSEIPTVWAIAGALLVVTGTATVSFLRNSRKPSTAT